MLVEYCNKITYKRKVYQVGLIVPKRKLFNGGFVKSTIIIYIKMLHMWLMLLDYLIYKVQHLDSGCKNNSRQTWLLPLISPNR